jgi:GntR family transcriptional regulator
MAEPAYRQIAEDLRRKIEHGELGGGGQLPTELELREEYNASRNTIRDAIKRLISLGYVETRPGQGTYVLQKIDPFVTTLSRDKDSGLGGGEGAAFLSEVSKRHRRPEESVPKIEVQGARSEIAARLRVAMDTQVVSRHQARTIDGTPWSLQTSFYPMDFATTRGATRLLLAQDIPEGTVKYIEETTGIKQVGYRDWITARNPDDTEQSFFGIRHDTTVFEVFRTAFDQHGVPMRVTVTVFPADRNQFIVNVGNLPDPEYDAELSPPARQ